MTRGTFPSGPGPPGGRPGLSPTLGIQPRDSLLQAIFMESRYPNRRAWLALGLAALAAPLARAVAAVDFSALYGDVVETTRTLAANLVSALQGHGECGGCSAFKGRRDHATRVDGIARAYGA